MIYWKLTVTDQSYDISCHDKKFVHAPWGLAVPAQGNKQKKSCQEKLTREIGLQWRGTMQSFVMLLLYFISSL